MIPTLSSCLHSSSCPAYCSCTFTNQPSPSLSSPPSPSSSPGTWWCPDARIWSPQWGCSPSSWRRGGKTPSVPLQDGRSKAGWFPANIDHRDGRLLWWRLGWLLWWRTVKTCGHSTLQIFWDRARYEGDSVSRRWISIPCRNLQRWHSALHGWDDVDKDGDALER